MKTRKIRRLRMLLLVLSAGLGGCGKQRDDSPLAEVLDRVRVLGVAPSPLVSTLVATGAAAGTTTLTVYAAVPSGRDVRISALTVAGERGSSAKIAPENVSVGEANYEEHRGFRLATVVLTVPTPGEAEFPKVGGGAGTGTAAATSSSSDTSTSTSTSSSTATDTSTSTSTSSSTGTGTGTAVQGGSVAYSFAVQSADQYLAADGEFLAQATGGTELTASAPTVVIGEPSGGSVSAKGSDISMTVTEPQTESTTLGWFVSDGALKDRRAASTRWIPGKGKQHSIVATARSSTTFGFAIQVLDVDSE